jgi:hypothetical protein
MRNENRVMTRTVTVEPVCSDDHDTQTSVSRKIYGFEKSDKEEKRKELSRKRFPGIRIRRKKSEQINGTKPSTKCRVCCCSGLKAAATAD